jgi:protein-tyrosine phosphatase
MSPKYLRSIHPAVPFSRLNSSRQERWMTERLSRLNFRDLGGLLATGGRHLRFGVLYRSEGPARFEAGHRKELAQLDFKLICDLRTDFEREAAPNDWTPSLPL